MQLLRRCLGVAIVAAFVSVVGPQANADHKPSEGTIERLLERALAKGAEPFRLAVHDGADLLDMEVLQLERGTGTTWYAVVELTIDYGAPSHGVIGFEQVRSGRYDVVLERVGEGFVLKRVSPAGRVHLLPTGGE